MKTLLKLAAFIVCIGTTTDAWAWDFTCSPEETTLIGYPAPSVLMMLDRSGSMDDADGIVADTCKVCEVSSGNFVEVQSASDCVSGGVPWSVSDVREIPRNGSPSSGYTHSYSFAVQPATADILVSIDIQADLNGTCEWADVFVDGDHLYTLENVSNCSSRVREFTIDSSYAADGQIDVDIVTSPDNNDCNGKNARCARRANPNCDGVDSFCSGGNRAEVTLTHQVPRYWGSQPWADPCGTSDKWEQALRAIDGVTAQAEASDPELVNFGLGLFSGTTAHIEEDCRPSNHDAIMSVLNSESPGGNTPTARAIRTSLNSSCVSGDSYVTVSDEASVPTDAGNTGYDLLLNLDVQSGGQDVVLDLTLFGDYGSSCEYATIVIDGVDFGRISDSRDCRGGGVTETYTVPATFVADGRLQIEVQTRGDGEVTSNPRCYSGTDGVDAYCADNRALATVSWLDANRTATATILITDGAPTVDINGNSGNSTSNYRDPIEQACEHRRTAPMFVVGLGAGTDEDYNNILAAAGGTGECIVNGTPVDPCTNPSNWSNLRNRCTGSIQAGSGDALLMALTAISAALSCTFNVNFFNSGHVAVPPDATNAYPYLYVEVADRDTGGTQQVFHKDSMNAPVPGQGWTFQSDQRQFVVFTDLYCADVQSYVYSEVTTHLACLCQEATGSPCAVPDHLALGVCPGGTWACDEGVDWCEPEANCCVPGAPCTVPNTNGPCAQGVTVCDAAGNSSCQQQVFPEAEICDNIDNDCDGVVDEISGNCTVLGQVGRCAVGTRTCDNGNEECAQVFGPMPELCNGLDDDCDGSIDNLSASWSKPAFAQYRPPTPDAEAAACRLDDVCMCPGAVTDDHAGAAFSDYVAEWDPVCQCGEGLAAGPMSVMPDDARRTSESEPAGCSSASSDPSSAGWLLFAFLMLRRRRR